MQDPAREARFQQLRREMVRTQIAARGVRDRRVLAAMEEVPRHLFVPDHLAYAAHRDSPLPIGGGQTISQPLMVATMVEALELRPSDRVLDVGGGSGYQAAVISRLAREVISMEIVPALATTARANLRAAGITNVRVLLGDGSLGHPSEAPYDAIVVAAAAPHVPRALEEQLAVGGRLVVPVGAPYATQSLLRVRRTVAGLSRPEMLTLCAFVPLRGHEGWEG